MTLSRIEYDLQFDACEAEELRFTGYVQSGFDVFAVDASGALSATTSLADMSDEDFEIIRTAPVLRNVGRIYVERDAGPHGIWTHHTKSGVDIYERALMETPLELDDGFDWDAIKARANGNLWKLHSIICNQVQQAIGCERAMVYKFHDDWSGEVVAESLVGDLEPYLGLHYPPTDIPKQARDIFEEIGTRHIFSTHRADQPLVARTAETAPVDLTHTISRSVSPYHLEYLRNMGSANTASCALLINGKLWGLLSLHYTRDRAPNLKEVALLQNFVHDFEPILNDTLENEKQMLVHRSENLVEKQRATLASDGDVVRTMLLSQAAMHRLLGGQGAAVVVPGHICSVGSVPKTETIQHICKTLGQSMGPLQTIFVEEVPADVVALGCGNIGGFAVTQLGETPDAFFLVFRDSVSQSVTWGGGDPRGQGAAQPEHRVSPRKSFEQWVERVEGRALPWTDLQKNTLEKSLRMMLDSFDVSPEELTILMRNSMRMASRNPDAVRENTGDMLESIRTAMVIGVETRRNGIPRIVTLNAAASDAFSVPSTEAKGLSLTDFETIIGFELSNVTQTRLITGVATSNYGIRDCEANTSVLFDYSDLGAPENSFRVETIELRDVTETRRIENALIAARDIAVREIALREEFYAKLNHELRTPLNVMIGLSSLILGPDASGLPAKTFKRLEVIKRASEHLAQIVDVGLQNSNSMQGIDDTLFRVCPVGDLTNQVFDMLRLVADSNAVELTFEDGADLEVFVEPRAARQLLINIIVNAIKYNVPKGRVHVSARRHTADFVKLDIADNGIGMTKDQLDRCMRPYQRFASGEGSGLGLSIAQHLASSIGGLLTIQSEQGVGTTVSILLPPLKRSAVQTQQQEKIPAQGRLH